MSLLSREHLVIGLAPARLAALRLNGRQQRLEHYNSALPSLDSAAWGPGMDALEILLDDPNWGGRDITVILSNHYVRYAVIPKGQALAPAELHDLARLIFRNSYGELAHDWEVRVSPGKPLRTLASAVPQALLNDLRTACEGRGTLRSIQPGLMAIFNRIRPLLPANSNDTLALVEPGRITVALLENDLWHAIDSRAATPASLPERLDETCALAGHLATRQAGGRLWLADLTGEALLPADSAWQVERPGTPGSGKLASLAEWGLQ